jgi:hypothetical protein
MLLPWLWRMHRWSKIIFIHFTASGADWILLNLWLAYHSFLWFNIWVYQWFGFNIIANRLVFKLVFVIFISIILSLRNLIYFWSTLLDFLASASLSRGRVLLAYVLVLNILDIDRLLTLVIIVLTKLRFTLLLSHLPFLLYLFLSTWRRFIYRIIDFNIVIKNLLLSTFPNLITNLLLVRWILHLVLMVDLGCLVVLRRWCSIWILLTFLTLLHASNLSVLLQISVLL